jgi:hypothetical protein
LNVGAGVRLGQAEPSSRRAGGEAWEQALLLLVGPIVEDDQRRHGVAVDHARQRHEASADLFDHARVGRDVEAEAAIFLGNERAEEAHVPHPRDEVVGISVGVLEGRGRGDDLLVHELAHRRDDRVRARSHFDPLAPGGGEG